MATPSSVGWSPMNSKNSSKSEKNFTFMISRSRRSTAGKGSPPISFGNFSGWPKNGASMSSLCKRTRETRPRYACTSPLAREKTFITLIFPFSSNASAVTGRNVALLAVKVLAERILSAGFSNPEIADEFVVSVNTVKTFTTGHFLIAQKGWATCPKLPDEVE